MSVSKQQADRCVTHHHACDCREYRMQEIERERDRYRALLVAASGAVNVVRGNGSPNQQDNAKALAAQIDAALEGNDD